MLQINIEGAKEFYTAEEHQGANDRASGAFRQVQDGYGKGNEWLGWRRILQSPNDAELERVERRAAQIRNDADIFIICGIGGSYQGARAVIDALSKPFRKSGPEIIYAGHHLSAQYLEELIHYLNQPKADGEIKSVYLNVISKSGSTLETAIAFRQIRKWMHSKYGDDATQRIIATTGETGGVLNKIIDEEGYDKFVIPEDVGGRFSVLTPVGLLPIAVAGIDIQTLYYGAVAEYEALEKDPSKLLEYAATRYLLHEKGYAIDVLSSFEPELNQLCGWTQQLLGESEGKGGKGLFPANASYTTDLHSIGQLIQQGQRNIIETVLTVKKPMSKLTLTEMDSDVDQLGYLSDKPIYEINNSALEGTCQAHIDGGVPVIRVELTSLNEQQLGRFIYFYELFTGVYVYMLGLNPFDQPGVENYKKAMYALLGKQ
ncbi:glucose-6-phosphate isomerase [Rhodohalobacter sp. SW132]|uniref:glucose-6-phosphate isomerase n=1 Tax=Rhodohalobacter sp. SW132 TaxID=2293433 RepID=UPI000E24D1BB|nr:glucose-6-phosphate isomerase [Rhodohalobacter sp. SW132]REL33674.1 glucose-6-phosphate isomerase [Rhodohalobacter sp. SW132]